jgi:phosphoglycerol transferase MdoB-like AlkP superfamily enzyme
VFEQLLKPNIDGTENSWSRMVRSCRNLANYFCFVVFGVVLNYLLTLIVYIGQFCIFVLPTIELCNLTGLTIFPLLHLVVPVLISTFHIFAFCGFSIVYILNGSKLGGISRGQAGLTLAVTSCVILLPVAFSMLFTERPCDKTGLLGNGVQVDILSFPAMFCGYFVNGLSIGTVLLAGSILLCIALQFYLTLVVGDKLRAPACLGWLFGSS